LLLALIGLMAGALLCIALSSARVAARALAEVSSTLSPKDWLSLGMPLRAVRGEPAGSQGEDGHRMGTEVSPAPGPQPVDASPACEDGRSSDHRAGMTAPPRTPKNPPRRDRRNPSVGWAWLSRHAPRFPTRPGGDRSIFPPQPPREEGEEQWTWG
jgi:hypothetical protein